MDNAAKIRENREYNLCALDEITKDGSRCNLEYIIAPNPIPTDPLLLPKFLPNSFNGPDWYKKIAQELVHDAQMNEYDITITSELQRKYQIKTESKFNDCGTVQRPLTPEEMNLLMREIVTRLYPKPK